MIWLIIYIIGVPLSWGFLLAASKMQGGTIMWTGFAWPITLLVGVGFILGEIFRDQTTP